MKYLVLFMGVALVIAVSCFSGDRKTEQDVLISKKFLDNNSFSIVCKGFPKEDLTGIARLESAKRAALLNAYFFIQQEFDESVAPDKDGRVEKFDAGENQATVYYILKKDGLKGRVKK